MFLVENRLAQFDAFAADIDIVGSFHQGTNFAITFAAKGAAGILFAASCPIGGSEISTRRHVVLVVCAKLAGWQAV